MRILFQALIIFHLLLGSGQLSFARDKFYNRDSSGYSYRIGPVLPNIQQDWQLGSLGASVWGHPLAGNCARACRFSYGTEHERSAVKISKHRVV